jgi:uncharacterized surface protein with fasciclin (FAS1) repeats
VSFSNISDESVLATAEYSIVSGIVAYSSLLTNGSSFKTIQGGEITITVLNGSIYADSSKILEKDYLISNGVLHILDMYCATAP